MPPIPKNNLKERMSKLGYNPNLVKIKPPVLDNSNIVAKKEEKIDIFRPEKLNLDEWSDFEEDE